MSKYITTLQEQNVDYEMLGIKRLIKSIIFLQYNDLKKYLKNPQMYKKFLASKGESPDQLINFWKNDAYDFLSFIVGTSRAKKFLNAIDPMILQAEEVSRERE